jgi:hypothetical protein
MLIGADLQADVEAADPVAEEPAERPDVEVAALDRWSALGAVGRGDGEETYG